MANIKSVKKISAKRVVLKKKKSILKNAVKDVKCVTFSRLKKAPHYFEYKSDNPKFKSCSIKYKMDLDTVIQATEQVEETRKKNNKWFSFIFFLINIVVVAIVIMLNSKGDSSSAADVFNHIKWPFLFSCVGIFVLQMLTETIKYTLLIYQSTRRFRPYLAFKVMALGKYYDNITPGATGGQPFQIYYFNKRGIKAEVATSIPLMRYIYWQAAYVVVCFVFLLTNTKYIMNANSVIVTMAWFGLTMNTLIMCSVLLISINKKVGSNIIIGCLKLLNKLKIIKDYQTAFRKTMRFVFSYQRCIKAFTTNIFYVIFQILLAVGEIILSGLLTYFIYLAFIPTATVSASTIISITLLCNLAVCFIPMPGGTGAVEISFMAVFGALFNSKGSASWATITYRVFTYYVILLMGILVIFYDFLIGNKKAEKYRKTHLFKDGFIFKDQLQKLKKKNEERKLKKELEKQKETLNDNNNDKRIKTTENEEVTIKEENVKPEPEKVLVFDKQSQQKMVETDTFNKKLATKKKSCKK